MVTLAEKVMIQASADQVWEVASDPLLVASCIPGATLAAGTEAGTFVGSIKVKFGPTAVTFSGLVVLSYDNQNRRCEIEGRGRDGRGSSDALATGTVTVEGDRPCSLNVAGEFEVSGPLEAFARTGGVHIARALLVDFARNLEHRVSESVEHAPSAETEYGPAREMHGGALLWRAFRSWITGLLSGRSAL